METNTRSMVRCTLPYDPANIKHMTPHVRLRMKLLSIAGGYTAYDGHGAWISNSVTETEKNIIYEVSFPPSGDIKHTLIRAFIEAGKAQGEQETYIEYHSIAFEAYHAKTAR